LFGIRVDTKTLLFLKKVWPGEVSVVLLKESKRFRYLDRGTKTLAFRLPNDMFLKKLLKVAGPLIAPSANVEGKLPATTIKEAAHYFGRGVDFYVDRGRLKGKPSTLVQYTNEGVKVLRKGVVKVSPKLFVPTYQ
jgi:L-threonylcarbamoyladenylate synthase